MKQNTYKRKPQSPSPLTDSLSPQSAVLGPSLLNFRDYQRRAFENKTSGIEVWLWARQVGKSFCLAAWAVDRLLSRPGRLVTVLSNSKVNGMELNRRCAEICEKLGQAYEQVDLSPDNRFETMNAETRIFVNGQIGITLPDLADA